MRWPLFVFIACLAAAATAADRSFPYRAFIAADDAPLRSGPGDDYYATETLKAGTEIEIYRHDPGGWYAIRPTKQSFSWVSSRHLRMGTNNLATVADEGVAARVGSLLGDDRDTVQIRLKKNETVEVLDLPGGPAPPWYRIAPPSGEFRYVAARFVVDEMPRPPTVDVTGKASARLPLRPAAPRTASPEQYQRQLDELELEISAIVVADSANWDFSELKLRAETLFDQADTPQERGRTRLLIGKIARFEDIRRRKQELAVRPGSIPRSPLPASDADGRFDAKGQLIRVPDPKPGGPQYAVLDAQGNMRCYVSPAPGVNLRSYVGRQVGITGIRGYMPEQRATHVMARQVSVVEGTTIR